MSQIKDINQGDLLTFRATDNKYKVLICTGTYKVRSPHHFSFAALDYDSVEKPTIDKILESKFFGKGNGTGNYFKYSETQLEKMWENHPEIKPYCLGSYGLIVRRKDFMSFRNNFELIDTLKIVSNLDKNGDGGMNASSWSFLSEFFNENYKTVLLARGQKIFRLKSIIME
jgi:hypothetical protein